MSNMNTTHMIPTGNSAIEADVNKLAKVLDMLDIPYGINHKDEIGFPTGAFIETKERWYIFSDPETGMRDSADSLYGIIQIIQTHIKKVKESGRADGILSLNGLG